MIIPHLTTEKWVVLLLGKESEARRYELTNSHLQSKLSKRVKLHSDNDIFIAPLSLLSVPYFMVYKKYNCTMQDDTDPIEYIARPQHEWDKLFY